MNRTQPARRGYTLIEMLLVISAVALVLGLCAGLLHVMLRLDRGGRAHLLETASVDRLARQLRQDAHAAEWAISAAADVDPSTTLQLRLPGERRVTYEAREHAIVRTEQRRSETSRHESYAIPSSRDARFRMDHNAGQVWIHLQLPRGPMRGEAGGPCRPRHGLQIDALVARDHRFATRPRELRP